MCFLNTKERTVTELTPDWSIARACANIRPKAGEPNCWHLLHLGVLALSGACLMWHPAFSRPAVTQSSPPSQNDRNLRETEVRPSGLNTVEDVRFCAGMTDYS